MYHTGGVHFCTLLSFQLKFDSIFFCNFLSSFLRNRALPISRWSTGSSLLNLLLIHTTSIRVLKGCRAPGLRTQKKWGSGAPDQNKQGSRAPRLQRNWPRAPGSAMLFCFKAKENPRIEKIQQFQFLKRSYYTFFSTLLMFHSYLDLFINHDQWVRLIFDKVNDVSEFEG